MTQQLCKYTKSILMHNTALQLVNVETKEM